MRESFQIVSVEVNPNQCRLNEELNLSIVFNSKAKMDLVAKGSLILDIAHVISDISSSTRISIPEGKSQQCIIFPYLDSLPTEDRVINNVAVYRVDFSIPETDEIVHTLNLVTAIDRRDGEFYRTVFSPLE